MHEKQGTMMRHGRRAGRLRVSRLLAACLVSVAGCDGDSLFDDGAGSNVPGPEVALVRPAVGDMITAGRDVAVEVEATDTLGVAEIELTYTGVVSGTVLFEFTPPRASAVADTILSIPAGQSGTLSLRATARNAFGGATTTPSLSVAVMLTDTVAPSVAVTATVPDRLELTDSIRVRVLARDNNGGSGLVTLGMTALVRAATRPDTMIFQRTIALGQAPTDAVAGDFVFAPPFVDARSLPSTLRFEFHAYAIDADGNCAGAVSNVPQRLPCREFRDATIAAGVPAAVTSTVVAGRSILLPSTAVIADAVVDRARERLYLSNMTSSQIELLELRTRTFGSSVKVGSRPWGLDLNRSGDTLIVANSGGTSVSFVSLGGTPVEAVANRIHTPNVNIFEVKFLVDNNGLQRLSSNFFDFSDRPQFVVQDAFGKLLYSTMPTPAASDGTIRVAEHEAGWARPEVRLLLGRQLTQPDTFTYTIVNIDSLRVFTTSLGDLIELYDHRNGFPGVIVQTGLLPLNQSLDSLTNHPDSDIRWLAGRFDLELVGLSDTTYVATSGNRLKVAFGEGVRAAGRIIMWDATAEEISNEITVADLVGNASEHILGLNMNQDGTLNTARGIDAAYFFREDLRLQGHTAPARGVTGSSGSVLHPLHPSYSPFPASGQTTLAFVADDRSIRIFDTVHFNARGEIPIRDRIRGPLRVSPALTGENAGCAPGDCIVAKLYGVTDAGTVVVVDVRERDIK